ncbi:MAG TPA: hypothetical protein VGD67_23910 [Pseudonocardiaceae bacterium]
MATSYTARHRALLLAVAQGRAQLAAGGAPDLTVDGRWCDHVAIAELLADGLLRPAAEARPGVLVPAVLTDLGRAVLRSLIAPARQSARAA